MKKNPIKNLRILVIFLILSLAILASPEAYGAFGDHTDSNNVWVSCNTGVEVTKINKSTLATEDISTPNPCYVGLAVDNNYVWVANGQNITKIDKTTSATTPIAVSCTTRAIAVDADYIWVSCYNDKVIQVLKTNTSTQQTISLASNSHPYGIVVDDMYVWVSNNGNDTVTQIKKLDLSTTTITDIGTLAGTTDAPRGIAVDSTYVWVATRADNNLTRIEKTTFNKEKIPVGNAPAGVAVDNTWVWVANQGGSSVTQILKSDLSTVATIATDDNAYGVSLDDTYVWVANAGGTIDVTGNPGNVTRIEKANTSNKNYIDVGDNPYSIGDMTGYTYLWWSESGKGEAIPEFTIITAIIAAVAGFGVYLLIRQRNSRKKIATNK